MKKSAGMFVSLMVLTSCCLAFTQGQASTNDVCLTRDIKPLLEKLSQSPQADSGLGALITPENIQVKGNCDSAVVMLGSFVKLADVIKKTECDVDIRFTQFVKNSSDVRDTVVSVCGETGALRISLSPGITFRSLSAGGFRITVPHSGQASWAMLEIRDVRGGLLHKSRKPFEGQNSLEFDWRPDAAPRGLRFFALTLGRGQTPMERTVRVSF